MSTKPKWEITKAINRRDTKTIYGQPREQLFEPKLILSAYLYTMILFEKFGRKTFISSIKVIHPTICDFVSDIILICPCNIEPLTSHFYIEKGGYRGIHSFLTFI